MRAMVVNPFFDVVEQVGRSVGEEFDAEEARIEEINSAGKAQGVWPLVKPVEQEEEAEKPQRKRTRKAAQ